MHHQLAGDQLALPDDSVDLLAQLRASFDLLPQQVSCGEVDETIFFDQNGALTK